MHDESKYPTLKFMKCKKCGHVFTCSLDGCTDCPECDTIDTKPYRPDDNDEPKNGTER